METNKTVVALLFGGKSSEHEVSLTSAASVFREIDHNRFTVLPILISRQGRWLLAEDTNFLTASEKGLIRESDCPLAAMTPVVLDYAHSKQLIALPGSGAEKRWRIDVALPILHGPGGEDGAIQGLLQMADIPCVGAGLLASAAGLDKVAAKILAQSRGVPTTPFLTFIYRQWQQDAREIIREAVAKLAFPMFVKPVSCGSSVGISKVNTESELERAVAMAGSHDRKIIIEKAIDARELECGVLGNDFPQASVVGEIMPANEFYDYQAKYFAGSKLEIPAAIPESISEIIRDTAVKVYLALDCAGMARVDFLLDRKTGQLYFNEINTLPGFTRHSMFPKVWEASGLPYRELITRLLELAMERGDK